MRKGFGFHDRHSPFRFNPATMFSAGQQGAVYELSDFSALSQDSAGTTPVTGVEQVVGRMLDKSGNGNHATSTGAARPTLRALYNIFTGTATLATQTKTTLAAAYTLSFSGAGSITLSGTATGTFNAGTHSVTCTAGSLTATVSGTVTNADMRLTSDLLAGPAYQDVVTATNYDSIGFLPYLAFDGTQAMSTGSVDFATVASDGQARRNLLLNPTQFDVSTVWDTSSGSVTVTANTTTSPDGSVTAYTLTENTANSVHAVFQLSALGAAGLNTFSVYAKASTRSWVVLRVDGASTFFDVGTGAVGTVGSGCTASITNVGNGWYRCVVSKTWAANNNCWIRLATGNGVESYTGDGTSGIYIWSAQLETGPTATAFQNIGADKMTVFAGVTKLSDAAAAALVELSASSGANNGAFTVLAPGGVTNTGYGYRSRGTVSASVDTPAPGYAAPTTDVITGISDISGDRAILRVDGVQAAISTGNQGTGNFGNYPLYIGSRNLASIFFSGRLYGLIVLGAQATDWQIWAAEQWMAQRTGISF